MKKCSKCKIIKPVSDFYIEKKGKRTGMPTSQCKECCTAQSTRYYSNNTEKAKLAHSNWVKNNKEKVAFTKAKSAYGITKEQWINLPKSCSICGSMKDLRIDHCHGNGQIRGVLCDKCNKGLGFFKDNPTHLLRASDYISGNNDSHLFKKPDIFEKTYEKV